jgi:hypothetical protein
MAIDVTRIRKWIDFDRSEKDHSSSIPNSRGFRTARVISGSEIAPSAPLETQLPIKADRLAGGIDAVLVSDDTALPKEDRHSVGVAPQFGSADHCTKRSARESRAAVATDSNSAQILDEILLIRIA